MKATTDSVTFAEFRQLLENQGYKVRRSDRAWIFRHPSEGLIVFRLYRDDEPVDQGDLQTTRTFLDLRGVLEAREFNELLQQADARA